MKSIPTQQLCRFQDYLTQSLTPNVELTSNQTFLLRTRSYHEPSFHQGIQYHHICLSYDLSFIQLPKTSKSTKLYHLHDDLWLSVQGCPIKKGFHNEVELISTDGHLAKKIEVGSNFSLVQVSPNGQIWLGFTEEGSSHQKVHLASAILACINQEGTVLYRLDQDPNCRQNDLLVDCYTLNVLSDKEVWACFYSGGVIQIQNYQIKRYWHELPSIDSIAVGSKYLLYEKSRHNKDSRTPRLFLTNRDSPEKSIEAIPYFKETPLSYRSTIGKENKMYFITLDGIYLAEIN